MDQIIQGSDSSGFSFFIGFLHAEHLYNRPLSSLRSLFFMNDADTINSR